MEIGCIQISKGVFSVQNRTPLVRSGCWKCLWSIKLLPAFIRDYSNGNYRCQAPNKHQNVCVCLYNYESASVRARKCSFLFRIQGKNALERAQLPVNISQQKWEVQMPSKLKYFELTETFADFEAHVEHLLRFEVNLLRRAWQFDSSSP